MWCKVEYSVGLNKEGENGYFGPAVCLSTAPWSTVFELMEWFVVHGNHLINIHILVWQSKFVVDPFFGAVPWLVNITASHRMHRASSDYD